MMILVNYCILYLYFKFLLNRALYSNVKKSKKCPITIEMAAIHFLFFSKQILLFYIDGNQPSIQQIVLFIQLFGVLILIF